MKLQKILSRLEKKHPKKIDLSLNRTFNLLKKLGNPQDKLKNVITVCGTNGKFSSIKSLQSILNQAGYNVTCIYLLTFKTTRKDLYTMTKKLMKQT